MKICLLRGPSLYVIQYKTSATMRPSQPLGLAYIAGALHAEGHEIYVIDAVAENPDNFNHFYKNIYTNGLSLEEILDRIDSDTEVLGISSMFSFDWLSDRHIIESIKNRFPSITIIAGGEHISALPKHSLSTTKGLSVCVIGEGEDTIVELIRAIQNNSSLHDVEGIVFKDSSGDIHSTKKRTRKRNLDEIPKPYWEIFPMNKYFENKLYYGVDTEGRTIPVVSTRGCPFQCTFCSSPEMWGTRYYMRDPKNVIEEIKYYIDKFNINNVDFFDLTAIVKRDWIIDFCKLLIENNLNITWQIPAGTRSEIIDAEVAYYLRKSGCTFITYAPESGSKEILKIIKKKVSLDNMLKSIKSSNKMGMNVKLNIIIGFPEDTHKTIWQTLIFHIKTSFAGANDMSTAVFLPYPGSAYFHQLVEKGVINIDDDEYFMNLIYANEIDDLRSFSNFLSPKTIRLYVIISTLTFYGFNFLFRPKRLFRLIKNLFNKKVESRMELHLSNILNRKKAKINRLNNSLPDIRL